jgi:outer membrane protein insertion porin family
MSKLKKFNFLFITISLFLNLFSYTYADVINEIEINGNQRISSETIISLMPKKLGDDLDEFQINELTKSLYETNFFSNISIKFDNQKLFINVQENPIIQKIFYNGIKSNSLKELITLGLNLNDRYSFTKFYAEEDVVIMKSNLRKRGYYFSEVTIRLETLDDNKVNLYFDIELGNKAKIKKISFVGEKFFKDKELKNIILSEEYKFWKFISGKKYLNEDLIEIDKRLLKNFFLNKGFYNAEIFSSYAKLLNENEFELIFNINSGKKIFFNDFNLTLPTNYDEKNFSKLIKTFNKLKGKPYSINLIEKITDQIDLLALTEEYETIDIDVKETIENNLLNIDFKVVETRKTNIKRINILGNNVTRENVIRNQFEIDEGDIYNEILFNKTINNLKSLNFFKNVNGKISEPSQSDEITIDILVEEKPTGELGASAGGGTNGATAGFFVKENNYLGKGLGLSAEVILNSESIKGILSLTDPNFNDSDKSVYLKVEAAEDDKLKDFGYKTNRTGFTYGTSFEFLDDFEIGIGNSNYLQDIETNSNASSLQKKQAGNYYDSFLNLDFTHDKRDQNFKPTSGFVNYYGTQLPLISKNNTLVNALDFKYYTQLFEDNVTSLSFYAKSSNSITNDNIKLSERNFLPARKLRGFERGRIGPKDGNDFIGGNYASSINITSTLPQILKENQNIDFVLFLDAGNVWGVDYNSSLDKANDIRSAVGISVDALTTLGPLSFSLAQPISKSSSDITETFRFNIGTSF